MGIHESNAPCTGLFSVAVMTGVVGAVIAFCVVCAVGLAGYLAFRRPAPSTAGKYDALE